MVLLSWRSRMRRSVDDDDGVEEGAFCPLLVQFDELIGEPGDGVRFAGASRMLDEIPFACAVCPQVGQKLAHDVELVVAGEVEGFLGKRGRAFSRP